MKIPDRFLTTFQTIYDSGLYQHMSDDAKLIMPLWTGQIAWFNDDPTALMPINDGIIETCTTQVAKITGFGLEQTARAEGEILESGIFSRTDALTYMSDEWIQNTRVSFRFFPWEIWRSAQFHSLNAKTKLAIIGLFRRLRWNGGAAIPLITIRPGSLDRELNVDPDELTEILREVNQSGFFEMDNSPYRWKLSNEWRNDDDF